MQDKAEIARHNRKRGKRVQKKINTEFGAENVGIFGGEDGKHDKFSVEAKGLKKFSGIKFIEQAERNNTRKVTPIVIVHIIGTRYDNDIIMLRIKDFKKLI
jgi:hypothetical protein